MSVVIVNKDDRRIEATLDALLALLGASPTEVVVVDASEWRLEDVRERYPVVRWIDYAHPRRRARTIAEQRNVGVLASTGAVVVFLDANCIPEEGWLDGLVAPIASGSESVVVGRVVGASDDSIHDVARGQGGHVEGYLEECSNMTVAFRRDVFDRVGAFNEVIGFAEDVDFSWRVRDAGIRILFNPAAVVSHEWGAVDEDLPRAFRYGVGRVRLYRLHRSRRGALLKGDFYITAYAAFTALLPIALLAPAYLGVLAIPLYLNRRRHPVRAVTYRIVYSLGVLSELAGIPVTKGQRSN